MQIGHSRVFAKKKTMCSEVPSLECMADNNIRNTSWSVPWSFEMYAQLCSTYIPLCILFIIWYNFSSREFCLNIWKNNFKPNVWLEELHPENYESHLHKREYYENRMNHSQTLKGDTVASIANSSTWSPMHERLFENRCFAMEWRCYWDHGLIRGAFLYKTWCSYSVW